MATNKNKKVTTNKLTTIKKVSSFVSTLETSINLEKFYPILVNKTESQVIEFVETYTESVEIEAKRISKEFMDANASSGTSLQSVAKFQNWFEILVSKHMDNNDEFIFNWSPRNPFYLSFKIDGIEKSLKDSHFSKNWMFPKESGRSYLTTKFKKADAIGSACLCFNLEIYASMKKDEKNATVELTLLSQAEKLEIVEAIKDKEQIKKSRLPSLRLDPETDNYTSILEMMIARFNARIEETEETQDK